MEPTDETSEAPRHVRVTLELPADLSAPALARRFVEEHRDHLDAALVEQAQLLVSELVTNAVRYGQPSIAIVFRLDFPGLGVEVEDEGADLPVLPGGDPPSPHSPGGRGLHILAALATRWGVDVGERGAGKTVWFELRPH